MAQFLVGMDSTNATPATDRLAHCSAAVRIWFLQNGLQLNADKSEVVLLGTPAQVRSAANSRRKWRLTDTDLCPCGETQTMSHIVESCPLTKLNRGLSRLHSADEDTVSWLTSYGS